MNIDDIIRMAREAGFDLTMFEFSLGFVTHGTHEEFEHFAALVAAVEREACAELCEAIDKEYEGEDVLATWCAAAIRARGQS